MKFYFYLIFLLFSSISFCQDTGLIIGKVLDKKSNNAPLTFANISLKGTEIKTTSDISGAFIIEYLKNDSYTIVCSFPGYKTKETNIYIKSGEPTEVTVILSAKTLSPDTASSHHYSNSQ